MDYQEGVVDFDDSGVVSRAVRAANAARAAGLLVIHVRVAFRAGYPEVNPHNRGWVNISSRGMFEDGANSIVDALRPDADDIVVDKRRISAFAGSDLDFVLRAQHVKDVVLAGVVTSGVVLSTVTEAVDRDYGLTVLSDACADPDRELHETLMALFARRGRVLTVDDWVGQVEAAAA